MNQKISGIQETNATSPSKQTTRVNNQQNRMIGEKNCNMACIFTTHSLPPFISCWQHSQWLCHVCLTSRCLGAPWLPLICNTILRQTIPSQFCWLLVLVPHPRLVQLAHLWLDECNLLCNWSHMVHWEIQRSVVNRYCPPKGERSGDPRSGCPDLQPSLGRLQ